MKRKLNSKILLAGSVSLITFLVYFTSLRNGFVLLDDDAYVTENPYIRSFDGAFFKWAFLGFHESNWHPLTWISHALDYAIWGLNPLGHHLTNNILHAINTGLVVLLVLKLLDAAASASWVSALNPPSSPLKLRGEKGGGTDVGGGEGGVAHKGALIAAATTGLLFGLHPLHVESVAWVSERKDLLCALFFLLSVMMYVRYVGRGGPLWTSKEGQPQGVAPTKNDPGQAGMTNYGRQFLDRYYLFSLFFFILALMSKPMAVTLPAVLLLLDWHPFERVQSARTFRAACIEKLPFIALSIVSSVITVLAQRSGGALVSVKVVPLSVRMLVAIKSLVAYLWKMVVPLKLIPFYPYPKNVSLLSPGYVSAMVLVIGITTACVVMVKKEKLWLTAWLYYVVTLFPVLGIVQVGSQSMADRYTYLPSLGPFLIVGLAAAWGFSKVNSLKKGKMIIGFFGATAAVLVFFSLTYLTINQIRAWKSSIDLWNYAIEREPQEAPIAYNNRGLAFMNLGETDRAAEDYRRAIAMDPGVAEPYYNLGKIYEKKGLYDEAIGEYKKAVSLKPDFADAYFDLGVAYALKGMREEAIMNYKAAVNLRPDFARAHYNLGVIYLGQNLANEAAGEFEAALRSDPSMDEARMFLEYARGMQKEK
jgi:Flp pilus assembly protein TadD